MDESSDNPSTVKEVIEDQLKNIYRQYRKVTKRLTSQNLENEEEESSKEETSDIEKGRTLNFLNSQADFILKYAELNNVIPNPKLVSVVAHIQDRLTNRDKKFMDAYQADVEKGVLQRIHNKFIA
jgi:hypothetical protein